MQTIGIIITAVVVGGAFDSLFRSIWAIKLKVDQIDDRTSRTIDLLNDTKYKIDEINERTIRIVDKS